MTIEKRTAIHFDHINPDSDYGTMVLPFYREEAAKVLQSVVRRRQNLLALKATLERSDMSEEERTATQARYDEAEKKAVYKASMLYEVPDDGFQKDTADKIKQHRYDLIDYAHPNFVQRLFATLRDEKITMNELMTAKLMYDSLSFIHQGETTENSGAEFQRYPLDDANSPYLVESLTGWNQEHTEKLKHTLAADSPKFHYYTINLKKHHSAALIHDLLEYQPVSKGNIETLDSLEKNHPDAPFIKIDANNIIDDNNLRDERGSIKFLSRLVHVSNNDLPLIVQPLKSILSEAQNNSFPTLTLILFTIDTLNILQEILFEKEAVIPVGVVGPLSTRIIRTYIDNSKNKAPAEQTAAEKILIDLYPTVERINISARAVEISHPDVPKTTIAHNHYCHNFLITLHDFFHTWRSSSLLKTLPRKLLKIYDGAHASTGKSTLISNNRWSLVDMDYSTSIQHASAEERGYEEAKFINQILYLGGFNFLRQQDNNYLLLYHLYHFPHEFNDCFFGRDLKYYAERNYYIQRNQLSAFTQSIESMVIYLKQHSDATIFDLILNELLNPLEKDDEALLKKFKEMDGHTIFYWSSNDTVCIRKKYYEPLKALGIKKILRENNVMHIREIMKNFIFSYLKTTEEQIALLVMSNPSKKGLLRYLKKVYPDDELLWLEKLKSKTPLNLDNELLTLLEDSANITSDFLETCLLLARNSRVLIKILNIYIQSSGHLNDMDNKIFTKIIYHSLVDKTILDMIRATLPSTIDFKWSGKQDEPLYLELRRSIAQKNIAQFSKFLTVLDTHYSKENANQTAIAAFLKLLEQCSNEELEENHPLFVDCCARYFIKLQHQPILLKAFHKMEKVNFITIHVLFEEWAKKASQFDNALNARYNFDSKDFNTEKMVATCIEIFQQDISASGFLFDSYRPPQFSSDEIRLLKSLIFSLESLKGKDFSSSKFIELKQILVGALFSQFDAKEIRAVDYSFTATNSSLNAPSKLFLQLLSIVAQIHHYEIELQSESVEKAEQSLVIF